MFTRPCGIPPWVQYRFAIVQDRIPGSKHILGRTSLNIKPRPYILGILLLPSVLSFSYHLFSPPASDADSPRLIPHDPFLIPSSFPILLFLLKSQITNHKTRKFKKTKTPTHQHRPRLPARITSNPTLPPIPQHDRNPIPLAHPSLSYRMRQRRTPLIQLSICKACVLAAGDEGRSVAVRGYYAGEVLGEGLGEEGGLGRVF